MKKSIPFHSAFNHTHLRHVILALALLVNNRSRYTEN